MKQLVDEEVVRIALIWLAVLGPAAGLLVGAGIGAARRSVVKGMVAGLALGLSGTLVYVLWIAHNAFTNAVGFDSAPGLLARLCVFALLGAALGLAAVRAARWYSGKRQ